MSEQYSVKDVQGHSKPDSLWIMVESGVYDMTKFQDEHPGRSSRHKPSAVVRGSIHSGRGRTEDIVLEPPADLSMEQGLG